MTAAATGKGSFIYVGNTMIAQVLGLQTSDGVYQNDADVQIEKITDRATGIDVPSSQFPLTYVPASNGNYKAVIPDTLAVEEDTIYLATFTAVSTAGYKARWTETVRARLRIA